MENVMQPWMTFFIGEMNILKKQSIQKVKTSKSDWKHGLLDENTVEKQQYLSNDTSFRAVHRTKLNVGGPFGLRRKNSSTNAIQLNKTIG